MEHAETPCWDPAGHGRHVLVAGAEARRRATRLMKGVWSWTSATTTACWTRDSRASTSTPTVARTCARSRSNWMKGCPGLPTLSPTTPITIWTCAPSARITSGTSCIRPDSSPWRPTGISRRTSTRTTPASSSTWLRRRLNRALIQPGTPFVFRALPWQSSSLFRHGP